MKEVQAGRALVAFLSPQEAQSENLHYYQDWRDPEIKKDDYVLTDDGWVTQVEYVYRKPKGKAGNDIIRIGTGTFPVRDNVKLHSEPRDNRFTVSGKSAEEIIRDRGVRNKDYIFAKFYVENGGDPLDAVRKAYPEYSEKGQQRLAINLLRNEKVMAIIQERVEKIFDKLNIKDEDIINRINRLSNDAESEHVKLQATLQLADMKGLNDKKEVRNTQEQFIGFKERALESVEQEKIESVAVQHKKLESKE